MKIREVAKTISHKMCDRKITEIKLAILPKREIIDCIACTLHLVQIP